MNPEIAVLKVARKRMVIRSAARLLAESYGVSTRTVYKIGLEKLLSMSEDARRILLKTKGEK